MILPQPPHPAVRAAGWGRGGPIARAVALLLLGGAAVSSVLAPVRVLARALGAALDVLGHTLVETSRGAALILRALTAQLTNESGTFRLLIFLGLTGAVVLLLRLINSYHRTRIPD